MFENVHEIILKVTRDCNLRCTYCYVRDKDRFKGERMSFQVFKRIIDRWIEDHEKSCLKKRNLCIVFHGGEPTLLPHQEMLRFINYARHKIPRVTFGIQTNMTNISPELAVIFQAHNISPGMSIDGWSSRHNKLRFNDKRKKLIENVRMLKKYNIPSGPLMVINSVNIKKTKKNIDKITREFSTKTIKANYAENLSVQAHAAPEVSAQELFENLFLPLITQFQKKYVLAEQNVMDIIESFFSALLFGSPRNFDQEDLSVHCSSKFCAGGTGLVEVDADGTICFCGRWDDVHNSCQLGMVDSIDLWGMSSYRKTFQLHLQKARDIRQKHCDKCSARTICSYGCVAFSYAKYKKVYIREDLVCQYFLKVVEYLQEHAVTILLAFARWKSWEIRKKTKKIYIIRPNQEQSKFNIQNILSIQGLGITKTDKNTDALQVTLC